MVVLAVVGATVPAMAQQDDDLAAGKFGIFLAGRQNIGELGDVYGTGFQGGFDAHYHPSRPGQAFSLGLGWATAIFGRSWAGAGSSPADNPLKLTEMSFGLRLRRSLSQTSARFLTLGAGVSLLRTHVPIPPDDERLYVGPYVGLAFEDYLTTRTMYSIETRYSMVGPGPRSVAVLLGIGFGAP